MLRRSCPPAAAAVPSAAAGPPARAAVRPENATVAEIGGVKLGQRHRGAEPADLAVREGRGPSA